ncbi:hypothetical protein [Catelliglobosispora koreensis]|uniref:hypothetical protein n=1 Tax=Catelliglobosispora koreensis TaxID=129052 RepID=UPI0012FCAE8E|nr:hypothetical protein [Catelliglobosispora koreensis]
MNDPEGVAHVIAHSDSWFGIHFGIVIGISLMLGGLVALSRSISDGPAGALSHLGLFAATVGVTVGLILVTLDGVAARQLAEQWAVAPADQKPVALQVMLANETVNFALVSLLTSPSLGSPTSYLDSLSRLATSIQSGWAGSPWPQAPDQSLPR